MTRATSPTTAGRRERKKALTRTSIAETALRMFLERGFDAVTVKEIADAADVSPTTVFKHFPTKEALVFDEDPDQQADLVDAVRGRPEGCGVLDALEAHLAAERRVRAPDDPLLREFVGLVERTPALQEYGRRMLQRHEDALADAIAETSRPPTGALRAQAIARFALSALDLAGRQGDGRRAALAELFALLRSGVEGTG